MKEEKNVTDVPVSHRHVILMIAILLALLPVGFLSRWSASSFFYVLALLPGAATVVHHVVSRTGRSQRARWERRLKQYYEIADPTSKDTHSEDARVRLAPSLFGEVCAALFLTSVFLLVAVFADVTPLPKGAALRPAHGIVFCGLGAYLSVLYYMGARMYASALSTRFLIASALRCASSLVFGWVIVALGVTNILPSGSTAMASLFLSGLFYSWALSSLRARAMVWFGAAKTDNEELPVGIVEGIDDVTADLLSEYGITTVQHLATTDAGELCERTLLPLDRILDWTNQAVLISAVKRNIVPMRVFGVRGATDLIRIADSEDPCGAKTMNSLAEKSGLSLDALRMIAFRVEANRTIRVLIDEMGEATGPRAKTVEGPIAA